MTTNRRLRLALAAAVLLLLAAVPAHAGTGGQTLPWNTPLQNLLDNLTGTTGKAIAGLAVAAGGIVWALGHSEAALKKSGGILIGIGLLLGAPSLITTLGFTGAVAGPPAATAGPEIASSSPAPDPAER
jgi:type IV secretion system protein TrbC